MSGLSKADAQRLRHVNQLLEQALALADAERDAWLRNLPPEHKTLAPLVTALLARGSVETDTFMRRPIGLRFEDLHELDALDSPFDQPGDQVGPYRLIRELGEGGMATVWLAERSDGVLQREVALKLPRAGWALGLVQRMARERDILATLEHRHIARLYDAGSTGAGRPYLAMEYVQGEPIDAYARTHELPVPARLRLILQVAGAVAHAHARLVVHRDLKPSNILITPDGYVRLLDFGVAKLLEDEATRDSRLTQLTGRALTPDYASPEQIRNEALTVASDVYSLGVVMYELLTGQRPYKLKRNNAAALEEAITEVDVPAASSRVADKALARALRGDIDTILAKALKKDLGERYPSVESMAADIERHLGGLPVLARADSFAYRAAKFMRRNRKTLAATAFALAAVTAGVVGTVTQAGRAQNEARIAQAQRDQTLRELGFAEASEELMRFLLSERSSRPFTTQEILVRAEQVVERQFADNPQLRARLQLMLADLHGELHDFKKAEAVLQRAQASARASGDAAVAAQVDCTMAGLYGATDRLEPGRQLFESVMASLKRLPAANPQAALTCHTQGETLLRNLGDSPAALAHAQAALRLIGEPRPGQLTNTIFLRTALGDSYSVLGEHGKAITAYQEAIDALARIGRGNTAPAAILKNNLGVMLVRTGQLLRAEQVFAQSLQEEAQRGDAPDPSLQTNHGRVLVDLGRDTQAAALFERALARHTSNGDKRGIAFTRLGIASIACGTDDTARCDAALADATALLREVLPPKNNTFGSIEWLAARAALVRNDPQNARVRLRAALAIFDAAQQPNPVRARVLALLARTELQLGDPASAQRLAEQAVAGARKEAQGIAHTEGQGSALLALAIVQQAQGDTAAARSSLQEALVQLRASVGEEAAPAREAQALLGARPPR